MLEPGSPAKSRWPDLDVFTLLPDAVWADHHNTLPERGADGCSPELRGAFDRIIWALTLLDILVEPVAESSLEGLEISTNWATSFQELAQLYPWQFAC